MRQHIAEIKPEDIRQAHKSEWDPQVKARLAAVGMVCMQGCKLGKTASCLVQPVI